MSVVCRRQILTSNVDPRTERVKQLERVVRKRTRKQPSVIARPLFLNIVVYDG